ncbi:DUF1007 family protein [Campylobacter gastrosuis]|uniref:Nickel/cobalt efflux system n=1 Tax=Campylobacter gastrosuis TaxID=2974576 RepID=A0ABT7HSW8_9BACT|nr:DUF1007 family protein [Campylobacter gastrosuis]MDL0089795.1 DUF1007 family protein [Campylobacter gastrosuis]
MRVIFAIFLLILNLHACALCSLYSPTAHVKSEFGFQNDLVKDVKFTWIFSENFSNLMLSNYDFNSDKIFSKDELKNVEKGLVDYLVPNGFLTQISYFYNDENATDLVNKIKNYELKFDENRLKFELTILLNLKLKKGLTISALILDKNEYFFFTFLDKKSQEITPDLYLMQNINSNVNFYKFVSKDEAKIDDNKPRLNELIKKDNSYQEIDEIDAKKFDSISQNSLNLLDKIKEIFRQNITPLSLFWVITLSFGYGFLHAAGPGHAKMLTSSYFSAVGGGYLRALKFALKVGFFHVFSAFVLVLFVVFSLREIGDFLNVKIIKFSTIISGFIVIFIALFMLFKTLKKPKIYKWQTHENGCACASCRALNTPKNGLREWILAFSFALVPCPGVILVFILAFELTNYILGLVSGVFMGLGMSCLIFLAALLGQKINQNFSKYQKILRVFGLSLVLVLGIFMVFISFKGGVF